MLFDCAMYFVPSSDAAFIFIVNRIEMTLFYYNECLILSILIIMYGRCHTTLSNAELRKNCSYCRGLGRNVQKRDHFKICNIISVCMCECVCARVCVCVCVRKAF